MVFKLDTEDVFGGQVEDGVYEVIINHATEDATPSGAEYINVDLIIRNDINQKFKNAHIFHSIWKAKKTINIMRNQSTRLVKLLDLQTVKNTIR
ncbi:hypothetical protein DYZ63_01183 [Listeria monocytogenes]|nr:hypothetical protein DYZ63_01183 [Listeria monocytogenes]